MQLTSSIMSPDLEAKNRETSRNEVAAWIADKPQRYFAYVKLDDTIPTSNPGIIQTWMSDKLGVLLPGKVWRDNTGTKRMSIDVIGTNGVFYYGTYYLGSGDYCRIKAYKNQSRLMNHAHYRKIRDRLITEQMQSEKSPCN